MLPRYKPYCSSKTSRPIAARRGAVARGAGVCVGKPVDNTELETRVKSLLRIGQYQNQLNQLNAELESRVEQRTLELKIALDELEQAWQGSVLARRGTGRGAAGG